MPPKPFVISRVDSAFKQLKNILKEIFLIKFLKDKNGYLTQDEFIEELGHMFQTMEAIKSFSILKKGFFD